MPSFFAKSSEVGRYPLDILSLLARELFNSTTAVLLFQKTNSVASGRQQRLTSSVIVCVLTLAPLDP